MLVVAIHGVLSSPKSCTSSMREWLHLERWLHLVSSFWLPLPFLTLKGVDRGEEKSELWFLTTLHTTENLLLVSVSFLSLPDFEIHLLAMDIGIMSTNLLGLALAVFYTKKLELFSELTPDNIPNLPSFGPEDVPFGPVVHQQQHQQQQQQHE